MTKNVHTATMLSMIATMYPPDELDRLLSTSIKSRSNFNKPEDRADCHAEGKAAIRRRKQTERNQK